VNGAPATGPGRPADDADDPRPDAGPDDAGRPLVRVVVVNYNGAHLLPDCLDALAAQEAPFGVEVCVVDNGSTDGSVELLRRSHPGVTVIDAGRNLGFAAGNNLAVESASTPYVALINNDARPDRDWIANLVAPLQQDSGLAATTGKLLFLPRFVEVELETEPFAPGRLDGRDLGVTVYSVTVDGHDVTGSVLWDRVAHPPEPGFRRTRPAGRLFVPMPDGQRGTIRMRLAAERTKKATIGGEAIVVTTEPAEYTVRVEDGHPLVDVIQNAGGVVLPGGYGADRGYQEVDPGQVDPGQYDEPSDVNLCGGSACLRTDAFRAAGGFDADFFMYYEDTDLSLRLRARGWRIRYVPTARARHLHAASAVVGSEFFTFHVERNRLLTLTKHAPAAAVVREVLRFPLTTASLAVREVARARLARRRPSITPTVVRLRVMASYLRLLPRMVRRRTRPDRRAGSRG